MQLGNAERQGHVCGRPERIKFEELECKWIRTYSPSFDDVELRTDF